MSNKHTPGPWSVSSIGSRFEIEDTCGSTIAQTLQSAPIERHEDHDERRANAHLIAAAPDLLEAIQEITDDYSDRFDLDSPSTNQGIKTSIARARAAIAKATRLTR